MMFTMRPNLDKLLIFKRLCAMHDIFFVNLGIKYRRLKSLLQLNAYLVGQYIM